MKMICATSRTPWATNLCWPGSFCRLSPALPHCGEAVQSVGCHYVALVSTAEAMSQDDQLTSRCICWHACQCGREVDRADPDTQPILALDAVAGRRIGAGEEVLMAALRESRRNLLGLEAAQKALEEAIKREKMQACA